MATVFNQMIEYAPVIEKAFDEKKINFLTLEFPKKTYKKWGHLQSKSNSIKKLKNHKTNIGIMLGFNRKNQDYYLAGLDLDGFNPTPKQLKSMQELSKKEKEIITNLTPEERLSIRNKTREDLYNLLKVLPDIWKNCTANQGYHLFYWTKRDFPNKFLENIFYPEDYPIKFLRNKSITFLTKHIEHFTYGRQFVAPFSEIKQNDGTKSYYYFISTREELTEFFENPQPKENILDEIKELVQNSDSGFTYKEPITTEPTPTTKNNKKPSKENTQINTGTGLLKSKISNPDIRSELLENIIKSGYTHGNMNNLGYVLVCNFRTGGLNKNEVYQIFKDLPIENHNLNLVKGWINNKFNINLNSRDFKKFAGLNALYTEIEAHANSEDKNT